MYESCTFPAISYSSTCRRCLAAIFDVSCCLQLLVPANAMCSAIRHLPLSMLPLLLYGSTADVDAVVVAAAAAAVADDDDVAENVDDIANESMLDNFA